MNVERGISVTHLTQRNGREKQNIASDTAELLNSLTAAYFHASWYRCNKNSCLFKPHWLDFLLLIGIYNPNEYRWFIWAQWEPHMGENPIYHLTSLCLSSYQRLIILHTPLKPVLIQATVQSFLMIHKGMFLFTWYIYPG